MRLSSVRSLISAAAVLAAAVGPCAFSFFGGCRAARRLPPSSGTKISTDTGPWHRLGGHVPHWRRQAARGLEPAMITLRVSSRCTFSTLGSGAKLLNTGAIVGSWSSLNHLSKARRGPERRDQAGLHRSQRQDRQPVSTRTRCTPQTAGKAGTNLGADAGIDVAVEAGPR